MEKEKEKEKEIYLRNKAITDALKHNKYMDKNQISRIETCNDTFGCNNKFCFRCQYRRRKRYFYSVKEIIKKRQKEFKNKNIKPMFLFITVDTPNIEASENNIKEAIQKIKKAYSVAKNEAEIKNILLGDLWGIDIANYKWSRYVMLHLHSLLAVKSSYHSQNYITKGRWLNLFQDVREKSKLENSVNVKEVVMGDVPRIASYIVKVHKIFDEIISKEEDYYSLNLDYDVFGNLYYNLQGVCMSGRNGYFSNTMKKGT